MMTFVTVLYTGYSIGTKQRDLEGGGAPGATLQSSPPHLENAEKLVVTE